MGRSRLLVVTLIAGVCLLGGTIPTHAGSRFPDTLDRSLELAHGIRISATSSEGVSVQRAARTLPIRGNLIAISMRTAGLNHEAVEDAVAVEARFHTSGGWSAWETLPIESDESPDTTTPEYAHAGSRVYTQPIWVGTADRMAFRVAAHAGAPAVWDLRAHVINTLGDAHAPTLLSRVVSAVSRFIHGQPAEAMTGTPRIISRRGWGADERRRECCPRYASALQMAFVHHTAGSNSYSKSQSAAIVRGIYRYHTSNLHYADIAYNFLIDRYGQIFEGRYGGITRPVIGAHAGGFNTGSTGISLMGTFTSATPPLAMIRSLKRLLSWKLDVHHVPPTGKVTMVSAGSTRYPPGTRVSLNRISAHRNTSKTACPGAKVYAMMDSIRSSVSKLGNPKIYLPSLSSNVLRPNGDGKYDTITLRARFSGTVHWSADFKNNGGSLLRRFTGTGTSLSVVWDGKTSGGILPPSGVVRYTINAVSGSLHARPADGMHYFVSTHPDGTVLSSPTRMVFLEGGTARLIPSALVYNSWFRSTEKVAATETDVDRYPAGPALTIREGTLLAEPDGSYSIFSEGVRRPFDTGVFTALGYSASAALSISQSELDALPSGATWSDVTRHPSGAIVRAPDGSEWTIGPALRQRNKTELMWKTRYRASEVVSASAGDIALTVGPDMTYRDGTTFRLSDGTLWIYDAGAKRRFYDAGLFSAMGYSSLAPLAISPTEAATIPTGPTIG